VRLRQWLIVAVATVVLVMLTATGIWTFRHAWAIYR
jgi:hypothetical protein